MICTCDPSVGETFDLFDESFPIACKEHTCTECNRIIKKGERYQRVRALFEGRWEHYKTCIGCQRLREDICGCYGDLDADVEGCFGIHIRIHRHPDKVSGEK